MLSRLILIFVAVPVLELVLLLRIGQWIGTMPTVALVVATGVAGAALARQQGLRAFLAVQRELAEGRLPGRSLLDGLSILVGGAFLLTPGVMTDVLGFGLLVPASRRWLQRLARRRLERRIREGTVEFQVYGADGAATTRRAEVHTRDPRREDRR
ncbi:MAG: FxsA family protein [Gemmatimonadota bacterium]|nr:FxsA family protein [Gemmatimonadota bacterium]MDE2984675.1 FxsA family protein [Gemmatimonadota bacterium]